MSFISWIVIGLLAGAIARAIVGGGSGSWLINLLLGVLGAVVGGWIASAIFNVDVNNSFFDPLTWLFAIIGGALVVWIYSKVTNKK